jgi:hypothetical protein
MTTIPPPTTGTSPHRAGARTSTRPCAWLSYLWLALGLVLLPFVMCKKWTIPLGMNEKFARLAVLPVVAGAALLPVVGVAQAAESQTTPRPPLISQVGQNHLVCDSMTIQPIPGDPDHVRVFRCGSFVGIFAHPGIPVAASADVPAVTGNSQDAPLALELGVAAGVAAVATVTGLAIHRRMKKKRESRDGGSRKRHLIPLR